MADLNLGVLGDSFSGIFSGVGGFLQTALISVIGVSIIGIVAFFGYKYYKNLTFYTTPISLTNKNKEYWINLFQNKLSKLYGYNYKEQKIIVKI